MDLIVEHVLAHTMQKVKIKEFVCYFKFRDNNELYLLFCSQVRIHSISFFDQGSPMIVLSGNCRVAWCNLVARECPTRHHFFEDQTKDSSKEGPMCFVQ